LVISSPCAVRVEFTRPQLGRSKQSVTSASYDIPTEHLVGVLLGQPRQLARIREMKSTPSLRYPLYLRLLFHVLLDSFDFRPVFSRWAVARSVSGSRFIGSSAYSYGLVGGPLYDAIGNLILPRLLASPMRIPSVGKKSPHRAEAHLLDAVWPGEEWADSRGEPRHKARTTKTNIECKTNDDVPERGITTTYDSILV